MMFSSDIVILLLMVFSIAQLTVLAGLAFIIFRSARVRSAVNQRSAEQFVSILQRERESHRELQPLLENYRQRAEKAGNEEMAQLAGQLGKHMGHYEPFIQKLEEETIPQEIVNYLLDHSKRGDDLIEQLSRVLAKGAPQANPETEAEPNNEPEAEAEGESETDQEAEAEVDLKTGQEAEAEVESEIEAEVPKSGEGLG